MYLKVDIAGQSQIYLFEIKKTINVGRAVNCDIQILAAGISRVHLEVRNVEDSIYVKDLGSTNGTFLDEEQLESGKEYVFNSFFPLRLGHHVYLYLLDEVDSKQLGEVIKEESQNGPSKQQQNNLESSADKTTFIQIKSLNLAEKKNVGKDIKIKKNLRQTKLIERGSALKRKKRLTHSHLPQKVFAFLLICGGVTFVAYHFGYLDPFLGGNDLAVETNKDVNSKQVAQKGNVSKTKRERPSRKKSVTELAPKKRKSIKSQTSLSNLKKSVAADKCLSEVEVFFCENYIAPNIELSFFEGHVKNLNSLSFIISKKKLDKFFEKELIGNDRNALVKRASRSLGKRFNAQKFIENNYRFERFSYDEAYYFTHYFLYVAQKNFLKSLKENKISNFTLIVLNEKTKKIISYVNYSTDQVETLLSNDLKKELEFAALTNIYQAVDSYLRIKHKNHSLNEHVTLIK